MGHIVGELNLNKTPQLVKNNSLVFAKNIRLLKDGTISRDTGLTRLPLDMSVIAKTCFTLSSAYSAEANKYTKIGSTINIEVDEFNKLQQLKDYVSTEKFNDSQYVTAKNYIELYPEDVDNFKTDNYTAVLNLMTSKTNRFKFPFVSADFFNAVARNDVQQRWHPTTEQYDETKFGDSGLGAMTDGSTTYDENKTYYKEYYDLISTLLNESSLEFDDNFFNTYFVDLRPYERIGNYYSTAVYEVLSAFVRDFSDDIVDCLRNFRSISNGATLQNNAYQAKIEKYNNLTENYSNLYTYFSSCSEYTILGYIPYNTKFYLFLKLKTTIVNKPVVYSIVCYDEHTNEFVPINCNWTGHGGKITGNAVTNLNGDIILNIGEYKDDETLIPFKSININKSSINDDESVYTQTPEVPVYNLHFTGYHTTPIPNGTYQFFIRYQIRENYYTAWYPASKELFAGSREGKKTNQGGLSYINLDYDAGRSFCFSVEKLIESPVKYEKFQIGFIISHDDENYARSWKHFDMGVTNIYFDYDQAYIEEIPIEDLTDTSFQLYNIQNITTFKDKLYVANYKETDFNPLLQTYADTVEINIGTKELDFDTNINGLPVTRNGNYITAVGDQTSSTDIIDIMKNLVSQANTFIRTSDETSIQIDSKKGITLNVTKTKVQDTNNVYYDIRERKHYWTANYISDPYNSKPTDIPEILAYLQYQFYDSPFKNMGYNCYPIHLTTEDEGKYMYSAYEYNASDTYKGFANALYNVGHSSNWHYVTTDDDQWIDDVAALSGYKTWLKLNPAFPIAAIMDMSGALTFSENIDNVITSLFTTATAKINTNTNKIETSKFYARKFWYVKKVKDLSGTYSGHEQEYVEGIYRAEGLSDRQSDKPNYTSELYEIEISFDVNFDNIKIYDGNTIDTHETEIVEEMNNLTTLIPYQSYKFFIHYMNKNGEITNGYQIGNKEGITIEEPNALGTIIYPIFSNIMYPPGYNSCFISIQHYKDKVATIFNIHSLDNIKVGDCIDLDTRLVSPVSKLPIVSKNWSSGTLGNYYGSFDSTYLVLFGSSGKVVLVDNHFSPGYAFIDLPYTNDADDVKLVKCTPFIKDDSFGDYKEENLLGYIGLVKKPLDSLDLYYSDSDVYTKTITNDTISLADEIEVGVWSQYKDSNFYRVYSNYNLNFISLALDVVAKVKLIDEEGQEKPKATLVAINSIQLSDIYELKSMYYSYSRRYFRKFTSKNLTTFDNTVRSSKLEGDEAVVNIYRFESGDYYNVPTNKGKITNLAAVGESILVHTQDALFRFVGSNTITANGGEDVALKENQPFESGIQEMFGSQYGYGGLQDKRNSIITQAGYFFYDGDSNIIYGYAGDNKLGELSSPIEKLMNFSRVLNIDFACDFYNDRLFINIKFASGHFVTLSYNLKTNSFVSLHDFDYDHTITTKDKCYFLNTKNIYVVDSTAIGYKELDRYDDLFPNKIVDNIDGYNIKASIIDVIYNEQYQQVKVLESIQWTCKAVVEYANEWLSNIERVGRLKRYTLKPFMAEEYGEPYPGEWLRIYSDLASTDLNFINTRRNDFALYKTGNGEEVTELERDDDHTITSENAYKYPSYNLGIYSFNYFRNILNNQPLTVGAFTPKPYKEDLIYELESIDGRVDQYPNADLKSLIYGKYFIGRFVLDSRVNFKLENVMFITTPYK